MSGLGKTKTIDVHGKEVTVRELTVSGLRGLLSANSSGSLVDEILFDVRVSDLEVFTSLTRVDINGMRPSDLRIVVDACKEVNADFFAMLAKVTKA